MRIFPLTTLFIVGLLTFACQNPTNNKVKKNPYQDDYTAIASLKHRQEWNAANVHDPTCIKEGDTYYIYSTDAYFIPPNLNFNDDSTVTMGIVPIRSSKDLIHWKFEGWAFDKIPEDGYNHVKNANNGNTPENVWAPYIRKVGDEFRLYYSVSYFGSKGSYIGMATSKSPIGPWTDKGEVVKTTNDDAMNAIDPSIVTDDKTGKDWMLYGSYFGGLYAMELNPQTGLALTPGDHGHVIACREMGKDRVIEAPEIIYNKDQDMYYMFVSYDPLFTFYNIRVGRSKTPEGPYLDYFGTDMTDIADNYPILTHSYMFNNHPGWNGNGHCSVINDNGKYYAMHQGRLAPGNLMLQMMVREIKWLSDGWPVLSPERYNATEETPIKKEDIIGQWEVIELQDVPDQIKLWEGQNPPPQWHYSKEVFNTSKELDIKQDGSFTYLGKDNKYDLNGDKVFFTLADKQVECAIFRGWDWENENETIVFSGILPNGHGVWGKKVVSK